MSKRKSTSPMFMNASRVKLPDCQATADTIVQMLVEGYPDGFSREQTARRQSAEGKAA